MEPKDSQAATPFLRKSIVLYDGGCGFCSESMRRWKKKISPDNVEFLAAQSDAAVACGYSRGGALGSVRVLDPDGSQFEGSAAVFRLMELGGLRAGGWALRLHRSFPPVRIVSDWIYRHFAARREVISRILGLRPDDHPRG